jgi:hypothetical protein
VVLGLLIVLPLAAIERYYRQSVEAGQTNERIFALSHRIEASRPEAELVVLDRQLEQERLGGGGSVLLALDFMLTVRGIPHTDLTIEPHRLTRRFGDRGVVLVLAEKTYRNKGEGLPLQPAFGAHALAPPSPYGVYAVGPAVPVLEGITSPSDERS